MSTNGSAPIVTDGWWELDANGYLWAMPTRVKILRVGAPGKIFVWDKKAKVERPLTIDDLVHFWCETRTRR